MKPGNAGGGKGPQVRTDDGREKGLGSGSAYSPEFTAGDPGSITCESEGSELDEGRDAAIERFGVVEA